MVRWAEGPAGSREVRDTFLAAFDRLDAPFDEHADITHVTGSAIVTGQDGALLHHHKRLGRWLQPGGHVDAAETPWEAAVREVREETGLAAAHPGPEPLLLRADVHASARGHIHLDLCYHLQAQGRPAPPPDESQLVRWFDWPDAVRVVEPELVEVIAVAAALQTASEVRR